MDVETTAVVRPLDLSRFVTGDRAAQEEFAGELDQVCRDTGFFTIVGHGVPPNVCTDLLDTFAAFFDLPVEEKRRAKVADEAANRGYTELGTEGLAYSRGETTPPDLFEAFNVGREDVDPAYAAAHRSFFAPNTWPARPADLQAVWTAYEAAASRVVDAVLEAMAIALDLPDDWFVAQCRNGVVTTRALNYERPTGAPPPEEGQMRLGAHTDYGILTLLLADDVPGLQVHREGAWYDVPTPPGAFVCNIGDMLERWTSSGRSSTLHRVLPPPASADGPVRRRSVARFLDGEPDRVVACIPSCCGPNDPPKYEPVVAGEWLRAKVLGGRTMEPTDVDRRPR